MAIVVKLSEGSQPGEWAVIELQGDLESRTHDTLHSQFIGDLHYTKKGVPVLIVGHHILYGKEMVLNKPFVILERKRYDSSNESLSQVEKNKGSDSLHVHHNTYMTKYFVKAIVKRKLLFKTRPKPIIANVPKVV